MIKAIETFPAKMRWTLSCGIWLVALLILAAASVVAAPVYGQEKKPDAKNATKLPDPEQLTLPTDDGLQLAVSYYPGGKGKQTIPIVLLHELKERRSNFNSLAKSLQAQGHAVVVPDLRGHGESTRKKNAGKDDKLDAAKGMPPTQFGLMVTQDMKAVKDFLWEKNNAGELNIDKLCVIGAEMGASVALDFAGYDAVGYDHNAAYYGPLKLGRFVKTLVLISPKWSFPGLPLRRAVGNPTVQSDVSMLILVGKQDAKALKEAKQIHGVFEKYQPEPTGDDKLDKQTLVMLLLDTSLQGTKLLDASGVRIEFFTREGNKKFDAEVTAPELIVDFISRRLVKSSESKDWVWKERKLPHE
jgi:pimeloyl-ACP methyl ester carboxylesterase